MNAIRRIAVIPTLLSWTACGQIHSPKPPAQFSETVLCSYKKDGVGAFSPYWAAYIVEPEKGAADQSTYVELNGKRLGPYAQVSGMMEVGGAGKHIAFAAKKGEKWTVVVDGVEKYTHDGLLWPWSRLGSQFPASNRYWRKHDVQPVRLPQRHPRQAGTCWQATAASLCHSG